MNITWLGETACHEVALVGGKAANLSLLAATNPVPAGFCLTTNAFIDSVNGNAPRPSELSATLVAELKQAYDRLAEQSGDDQLRVAVRSSAVDEDGLSDSFAGQHETYLNVPDFPGVKEAVQLCWQSAFSDRALAYRHERGIQAQDVRLAVLIQQLVMSDVSGVVFSLNPITCSQDEIVITTSWGLGESVVGGTVTPDTFTVRKSDLAVISRQIASKEKMTVGVEGGTKEVNVPRLLRAQPSISDEQAVQMARLALDLESRMGWPVDLECAFKGDQLYLLQCRPVTVTVPNCADQN